MKKINDDDCHNFCACKRLIKKSFSRKMNHVIVRYAEWPDTLVIDKICSNELCVHLSLDFLKLGDKFYIIVILLLTRKANMPK